MSKILFWGAGKNGKLALNVWRQYGYVPDFFIDNNNEIQHSYVDDIEIISPHEAAAYYRDGIVLITSGYESEEIRQQLLILGYDTERIYFATNIHMIYHAIFAIYYETESDILKGKIGNVLFDFSNGMVLGGVESWNVETMNYLTKFGFMPYVLTRAGVNSDISVGEDVKVISFDFWPNVSREKIEADVQSILDLCPCTIICNFPDYIFVLAVAAKIRRPNEIRIISVQHNDESIYYLTYSTGKKFMNRYLFISGKMRDEMNYLGFPEDKMSFLPWAIPCRLIDSREENDVRFIRIGYAGRIVREQKRVDLLVEVIKRLADEGVRFELNIAGTGSYFEEIKKQLNEINVHFYGMLSRNQIMQFWEEQDVMLSCSDFEGHSISQCEAMAAGAVPIVTDVSGVRDDVTDGENGFIVTENVVEQMTERIMYLDRHRDVLVRMGRKAAQTIRSKYQKENVINFWKDVLGLYNEG